MRSIRRYLTLLLISSLVLIIFFAAIHGFRAATSMSSALLDKELQSVYQTVTFSQLHVTSTGNDTEIAYQIWRGEQLLAQSPNAPARRMSPQDEGFYDQNFNHQRWRVYSHALTPGEVIIMVAQPIQNRFTLAESLTSSAITPFIYSVPILALIIFLSVSRGLSPLKNLSAQLSARKGKDLSAVSLPSVPNEMRPVVNTLNTMFHRLNDAFEREQQFAANAAHELRTPLSVMKINLHNLAQELADKSDKLEAIQQDTNRMIHVVNQILLLSRTSPELFHQQMGRVDAHAVAQSVITDMYSQIESRQQDIELRGDSAVLMSTEFSLYTLLQNLIGNAINYSPTGASIVVDVQQIQDSVILAVDDSGPGIAPEERDKVLQRFYRDQSDSRYKSQGSGLGLAIVSQIVAMHHASVSLHESELGGLRVEVRFPCKEAQ